MRYYSASQFTNPGTCPVSFEIEKEEEGRYYLSGRLTGHARTLYDIYLAKKQDYYNRFSQFEDMVGPFGLHLVDKIYFKEINMSKIDVTVRVGGRVEKKKRQKVLVVPQFKKGNQILSPTVLFQHSLDKLRLVSWRL
jgi:hypothetical protein